MKKQDLLKKLMAASELEETHSSRIARFFLDEFDWEGIDPEKVKRVKTGLSVIQKQTSEHEKALDSMVAKIREMSKDEF